MPLHNIFGAEGRVGRRQLIKVVGGDVTLIEELSCLIWKENLQKCVD